MLIFTEVIHKNKPENMHTREIDTASHKAKDRFGANFFRKIGTTEEFFSSEVSGLLDEYSRNPERFDPEEELLVLNKMNTALLFEKPGIADAQGVYAIADTMREIAYNKDFPYVSELGRRYAQYCVDVDRGAYFWEDDLSKPLAGFDADRGGIQYESAWNADLSKYVYAHEVSKEDEKVKEGFRDLLNSPNFQSFLAREVNYGTKDFGGNFPIGLYVDYMLSRSPEECEHAFQILGELPRQTRSVVAEAFFAVEFGDDLGNEVLHLAEHHSGVETLRVAENITSIMHNSRTFTTEGMFAQVDSDLADDIRRGISTRTAEVMYALNQRLAKGKTIEAPAEALAKLQEWSSGVAMMLQKGIPQKVQEAGDTQLFHFIDPDTGETLPGAIELTGRGKMPEDATARERYIKEGKGARISITYDADHPQEALSLDGSVRRKAMNGRLDKSTYFVETGKIDPDAEWAEVSFDIGSAHADGAPKLVADVIGEARAIRGGHSGRHAKKLGLGAYTYDIIDQRHGQRDVFSGFVKRFGDMLLARERQYRKQRVRRGMATTATRVANTR